MRGDICKISLVGKLENGTVVEKLEKYTVQVGDVEVIKTNHLFTQLTLCLFN